MSKHIVGMTALDTTVRIAGPGEVVGEDAVPAGQIAVVIETASDVVVIEGTPQTLRHLVFDGLTAPIPADVPLNDDEPAL